MGTKTGTGVATVRDAERTGYYLDALFGFLVEDARVWAAYDEWKRTAVATTDTGAAASRDVLLHALLSGAGDEASRRSLLQIVQSVAPEDAAVIQALLASLNLAEYGAWLADLLLRQFILWSGNEADGLDQPMMRLSFSAPPDAARRRGLPEGRRPKTGETHAEDVARNVGWFFRKRVNGESERSLAREFAASRGEMRSETKSAVQNGIKRVEQLLKVIDSDPRRIM